MPRRKLEGAAFLAIRTTRIKAWACQVERVVKNPPADAGDVRDTGSIPGLRRSPGGGRGNPPSILPWRIPQTEDLGRLQSIGSQRVGHN